MILAQKNVMTEFSGRATSLTEKSLPEGMIDPHSRGSTRRSQLQRPERAADSTVNDDAIVENPRP